MLNVYEELGDTSRRQILAELRTGPKHVSELCDSTRLKQPNVSNHLARMRARGIVRARKVGRQVFYSLASPEIEAIVNSVFNVPGATPAAIEFDDMARDYAKAAIQGDEQACGEILDRAFRAQVSLIDIYEELLAPAMTMVGNWWKVEAIDEAQEHMASAVTERMMARAAQIMGPMRRNNRTAILGCAPNSYHVIGLRMIGDYLRLYGWKTLFLGANVPVKSFVTTVRNHQPHLVLLSCGAEESIQDTLELIRKLCELRDRRRAFQIGVGGGRVAENPDLFVEAGADFTARDLRSFARERLKLIEDQRDSDGEEDSRN
ncbi:MAG: metalloregulator ArsR/SmtB family transcription factor [Fimbriimonadaceae bacterium]|nr:metalloregulator ArsR/SmtB family transcription factor [Fimbriimonadaceae bacterium]